MYKVDVSNVNFKDLSNLLATCYGFDTWHLFTEIGRLNRETLKYMPAHKKQGIRTVYTVTNTGRWINIYLLFKGRSWHVYQVTQGYGGENLKWTRQMRILEMSDEQSLFVKYRKRI